MRGRIGQSMQIKFAKKEKSEGLQRWLKLKNEVLEYLRNKHSVASASRKFRLKTETIYKMINSF